jgi:hypothetical protein
MRKPDHPHKYHPTPIALPGALSKAEPGFTGESIGAS